MIQDPTIHKDTAVIIPNFNGLGFLRECMSALGAQTYTSFRVIVVDNGSTDGSAGYLRELLEDEERNFPLECIFLGENTGFSRAANRGIAEASAQAFAVLLNNDTSARPDYLEKLISPMKEPGNENIAAVSPLMLKMSDPTLIDDAGDGYNVLGWAFQRGTTQAASKKRFSRRCSVFSACAGAAAYRMSALSEIRLDDGDQPEAVYFDPEHFAYLEDVDLSFRLRIHGYGIIYEPGSQVLHVGSGTSGSRYNYFKVRLAARNNIYLLYKNLPVLLILINLPGILAGTFIKQLFFLRMGLGAAYFKGLREGLMSVRAHRLKKTYFRPERSFSYLKIELMLIRDTFSYVSDCLIRQAGKVKHAL